MTDANRAYYAGKNTVWYEIPLLREYMDGPFRKEYLQGVRDARAEKALDTDEEWD